MSEEINRLEALIAHQERQIQDLSDIVNLHRKEIEILKTRLDRTQKKIVDIELGAAEESGENFTPTKLLLRDKPPHY